jgi:hypothetical protein
MKLAWLAAVTAMGCSGEGGGGEAKPTDTQDTAGGGGETPWKAAGAGKAYFADGDEDNSLFTLELSRVLAPADGNAYYGFLSVDGADVASLGEIIVSGEDVTFNYDLGVNGVIVGYNHFEAWHNATGVQGVGDPVWEGDVDPTVYAALQNLLVESDSTLDGQGTMRSLETTLEDLAAYALAVSEDSSLSVSEVAEEAEMVCNAIEAPADDHDGDGTITEFDSYIAVLGDTSYVEFIRADLDAAYDELDPLSDSAEAIRNAYDGIDSVVESADYARGRAYSATAAASASSALYYMGEASVALGEALTGADTERDEDTDIDPIYECGLEGALDWISQAAQMEVGVPSASDDTGG